MVKSVIVVNVFNSSVTSAVLKEATRMRKEKQSARSVVKVTTATSNNNHLICTSVTRVIIAKKNPLKQRNLLPVFISLF